jgi:hypothetical protein
MSNQLPWEAMLFDWQRLDLNGNRIPPEMVLDLCTASSDDAASLAYFRLDGTVLMNGIVSPAALPVVQTLLALLPSWSEHGKAHCLDLLSMICSAQAAEGGTKCCSGRERNCAEPHGISCTGFGMTGWTSPRFMQTSWAFSERTSRRCDGFRSDTWSTR